MRAKFLFAGAAALWLAGTAGIALAQSSSSSTTTTTITQPVVPGGPAQVQTQTYVGRPLFDSAGHQIGTITERRDNSYYVTADQYLGVGQKTYILPHDKVIVQCNGQSTTITTPLTREQIIVLPSP